MRCPSLSELPLPPIGRTGWPWTEESVRLADVTPQGRPWPRITVVTPSFNQGRFIEETIRSILLQGYPDLEYFILDGGSTDKSVEIIKKYSPWIRFWVSERDGGQSAAINRGLRMGSGVHATWINSDDMLCKDALTIHVPQYGTPADVVFIGDCIHIEETGNPLFTHRGRVQSFEDLVRLRTIWRAQGWIDQPAVIFPLELAIRVGGLNERNRFSMDYELWGEFLLAGAKLQYTQIPFGFFRWQSEQKTRDDVEQLETTFDATVSLVGRANFLSDETREEILQDMKDYRREYREAQWKQSGRLARMGLPRSIVAPMRKFRHTVQKKIANFMLTK